MVITLLLSAVVGLLVALGLLIWLLPTKVQYLETITINAPIVRVYDAIRYQDQLMAWSAWPTETNSACAVRNTDGQPGAQTVYMNKKGKPFGYQEVTELVMPEKVSFYLKSYVAPFEEDVRLTFLLKPLSEEQTEVTLWFDERLKKPQFIIAYVGGIINWVHSMHLKDLQGLKRYVEQQKSVSGPANHPPAGSA